jgi:hypothetical protein
LCTLLCILIMLMIVYDLPCNYYDHFFFFLHFFANNFIHCVVTVGAGLGLMVVRVGGVCVSVWVLACKDASMLFWLSCWPIVCMSFDF